MVARLAAFVIWAAVAASAVYWGAKLLARPAPVPAHAVLAVAPAAIGGDLSRVLGADAPVPQRASAVPAADPRFRLIGVAAPRGKGPAAVGVALIATDGKVARAYRIGAVVDGDLVLQAVHARGASLGARGQPAQVVLELPALPPPSVGVPAGAGQPLPVPGMPPPGAQLPRPVSAPARPAGALAADGEGDTDAPNEGAAQSGVPPLSIPGRPQ